MSTRPKISVVIPVYNAEPYLEECLDSVIGQTFSDIEIICVDDGSTDGSKEILERCAASDDRVIILSQENNIPGAARDLGIKSANGIYICVIDCYDYLQPDMLEKMAAEAEEKDADLILCQANFYSEKKQDLEPMPWSLNKGFIPPTEDGCYNRNNNGAYLFQSTTLQLWNKLIKKNILDKAFHDQIPDNDLVLSCMVLALAEKIYPLFSVLYVHRKDFKRPVPNELCKEEKIQEGYNTSLSLLTELKKRDLYTQLWETYQRFAIHECMWKLEHLSGSPDLFSENFIFLQNEGFSTLELDTIHPSIIYYNPDHEYKLFAEIQSGITPCDYYYRKAQEIERKYKTIVKNCKAEISQNKKKISSKNKKIKALENTAYNRLIKKIGILKNKIKRKIKSVLLLPQKKQKKQTKNPVKTKTVNRYENAGKRIAFLAFENFHYEVLANMMRICNPQENYLIAYVHHEAKTEVSKVLGKLSSDIEWHDFMEPNLKAVYEERNHAALKDIFFEDVLSRPNLDHMIIPSPEYHPEWYIPVAYSPKRKSELIIGIHNLNTNLFAELKNQNIKLLFEKADAYSVIDSTLKDYMVEKGIDKKIYVFPQIYDGQKQKRTRNEKVTFVITGWVEEKRRNYQFVVDSLKKLSPEAYPKIKLVLLGRAVSEYAHMILDELQEMEEQGLEVVSFSEFIPNDTFSEEMNRADFLLAPVNIETENYGCTEYYGKTKISGVIGDMIRYAIPALINQELNIPKDLSECILRFDTEDDLCRKISKIIANPALIQAYQDRTKEVCKNYSPQNRIWRTAK